MMWGKAIHHIGVSLGFSLFIGTVILVGSLLPFIVDGLPAMQVFATIMVGLMFVLAGIFANGTAGITCERDEADASVLRLTLVSPDGEESYPGTVKVTVEYRLTQENELKIRYRAQTDRATPLSLTDHTYFNLNGFSDRVLDHQIQIDSERYLVPDRPVPGLLLRNVEIPERPQYPGIASQYSASRPAVRRNDGFQVWLVAERMDGEISDCGSPTTRGLPSQKEQT
jgi:hypothetical protein